MANTFFRFKQFTVHQELCAMKVSTDACIFGGIVAPALAKYAQLQPDKLLTYLDIGTGTGLLSLMIAQKTTGTIYAVDIDAGAAEQAAKNIAASIYAEKISVFKDDILQFKPLNNPDGIFCNPPFYEADLHSPDEQKNAAKHDTHLTLQPLADYVAKQLKPDGLFAILLPYQRINEFIEMALNSGLFLSEKILVRHSAKHTFFRGILFFTKTETAVLNSTLIIRNEEGTYSDEFILLLRDYYLNL